MYYNGNTLSVHASDHMLIVTFQDAIVRYWLVDTGPISVEYWRWKESACPSLSFGVNTSPFWDIKKQSNMMTVV
ncbi:uncharacterized protein N7511_008522 [Penicillium nucicola]|uniref:uncharacterized protein n=1 Tax=Penicillium nucicola TaxID=1850975 RepID=UPI0025451C67|nr:uncharacterized protein N7511_011577 [Penicillium nucicola]XP_056978422.1 uncharacterized protein N7511_011542 [Penicillium nucicola]XP_056978429.1 uncharacterized protein N7511_011549 [Penicillium nucicola]XP_056978717.1 uncharacterized protein N7511_011383 [Penicillium nucicola]XP_056981630.1 uncharacterized protein N7511_008522 [Penicillium nucicola]KAJ5741205.1 hypothetical protein N7511_011577 [Penicillium nucicola]KAJ5742356.1 hypothetical protein N7511_011542 [Penicillium nucicola]